MSRKRTTYTASFKAKLVLEVLEGTKTLNEIATQYELLPKNLLNWKKQFLDNASLAFDKSALVKEYKIEIETLQKDKDNMAKKVGELTLEKDFLEGKLVSLVSLNKRKGLNEKFRGLKTQVNYDTIGVKKGLFTNGCKKTIKLVHIV